MNLRGVLLAALFAAVAAVGLAMLFFVATDDAGATPPNPGHKVTICHATPPATAAQGYNLITVDIASTGYQHSGHQAKHAKDIIPPYYYVDTAGKLFVFGGKNFDAEGQAIWLNGCRIPTPVPTPTPTPTPPSGTPTPTPTPVVTPSPTHTPPPNPTPAATPSSGTTPTPGGVTPVGTSVDQAPVGFPDTGGAPECEDRVSKARGMMAFVLGAALATVIGVVLMILRGR